MSEVLNHKGLVRFYFIFTDGIREIIEPNKFDASNFTLEKDDGELGLNVFFGGGKTKLSIAPNMYDRGLTQEFEKMCHEFKEHGFEADVKFAVSVDIDNVSSEPIIMGEISFSSADTDLLTYFEFTVIQEDAQAVIRRRKEVKVNLFSDTDLNGNLINPLTPSKMLFQATPESQDAFWKQSEPLTGIQIPSNQLYGISFTPVVTGRLEGQLSPLNGFFVGGSDDFGFLFAANRLTNPVLTISDGNWSIEDEISSQSIAIRIGVEFDTADIYTYSIPIEGVDYTAEYPLRQIERNEKMWVYFLIGSSPDGTSRTVQLNTATFNLKAISLSVSSTLSVVRLGDAIKQVITSISGLNVKAPRFFSGGEFYDQYLTGGLLIRDLEPDTFTLSLQDILDYFPEINGGYQIEDGSNIFFGIYEDFYVDKLISTFNQSPDDTFKVGFDKGNTINKMSIAWSKYENENDEEKSRESVHTKVEFLLPNQKVEGNNSLKVLFARDGALIEKTRKDGIIVTEDTATKEDETKFIIDGFEKTLSFTERLYVNHILVSTGVIKLINDGSFNWSLLGIQVGDSIVIDGQNADTYTVTELGETEITLTATTITPTFTGLELTAVSYTVTSTTLTQRTNEGFDFISGASSPEGYANLRFTPQRVIRNYWGNYLLTSCYYQDNGEIKVTDFVNNEDLVTKLSSESFSIREGDPIPIGDLATNGLAILSPNSVETTVLCDSETFLKLSKDIRVERGYIDIESNLGELLSVHPTSLEYDWDKNILNVVGKVRTSIILRDPMPTIPPVTEINNYLFDDENNYVFEDGENFIFNN